ncbi:hypothetical protein [Streptomyces sp. MBT62]|uniref:hypothetical protein n=1 Tax=Streptomyces sp. MBT62 TaxID=2800410 RepID=UPI00190B0160|nr:hypothetical protein [Streptomyces sp. MBT62]MBK3568407.1 hypothetical protein [Streptomyces sp. MBT62]
MNCKGLGEPLPYSVHEVLRGDRKFTISVPYDAIGPLRFYDMVVEAEYEEIKPPTIYALRPHTGGY